MLSVTENIASVLTVGLVLLGIIAVLVCLHCGSDYLLNHHRPNEDAKRQADRLRRESEHSMGITRHSLFYDFFFRD